MLSTPRPWIRSWTPLWRSCARSNCTRPQIPIVSNVTGTWLKDEEATDPQYWARHMRQTVRFADGLATLRTEPGAFLIEIGPGETLSVLGRQHGPKDARQRVFPSLPRSSEKNNDLVTILTALGNLWIHGTVIDWESFHAHETLHRVPLPPIRFSARNSGWARKSAPTGSPILSARSTTGLSHHLEIDAAAPLRPVAVHGLFSVIPRPNSRG